METLAKCDRCSEMVDKVFLHDIGGQGDLEFCKECEKVIVKRREYEYGEDKIIDLINSLTKQTMQIPYSIDKQILVDVLTYLESRPYLEVKDLISRVQIGAAQMPIEKKEPVKKEKKAIEVKKETKTEENKNEGKAV